MTDGSSPSVERHREAAAGRRARVAVLTISDTRSLADDSGGATIVEALEREGHEIVEREIVPDEAAAIDAVLERWLAPDGPELIVTTGGTGIARRDTTIEVVERRLDQRLDGFGELFRMLSYAQVGAAAMLSRATAGLSGETFLFALPGSPAAVSLALDELILPELAHLLWERRR